MLASIIASATHAASQANDKPWRPSPSVTIVRNMLESCDNRAGSAQRHGKMSHRHAEWPHVADGVIEARFGDVWPPANVVRILTCPLSLGREGLVLATYRLGWPTLGSRPF